MDWCAPCLSTLIFFTVVGDVETLVSELVTPSQRPPVDLFSTDPEPSHAWVSIKRLSTLVHRCRLLMADGEASGVRHATAEVTVALAIDEAQRCVAAGECPLRELILPTCTLAAASAAAAIDTADQIF